jgi:hypothetical protein
MEVAERAGAEPGQEVARTPLVGARLTAHG